jgi:hypothetical protein
MTNELRFDIQLVIFTDAGAGLDYSNALVFSRIKLNMD